MASTADIKKGICINHSHDIFKVVDFLHVKPGKGAAFVRTKLKSVTNGKVLEHTFPSGHKIEIVRVERREYQYQYTDSKGLNFMDTETFEEATLHPSLVDNAQFLKEGMMVSILFDSKTNDVLTTEMPASEWYTVIYSEPGVKGDTATNASKPATLETKAEVRVPLFINEGDIIRINLETGEYLERKK
jgi:elongation factor P